MVDWSKYSLTNIPFLAIPAIKINSRDIRANGRLYYSKFAETQITDMTEMIAQGAHPIVFLLTEGSVLGNGKSAFFAHIYWNLKDQGKNVLWAVARDDPRLRNLLSSVLDSYLNQLKKLKKLVQPVDSRNIRKLLNKTSTTYDSNTIKALVRILSADEEDMIYMFSTIKRRIPTEYYDELFGALLNLTYSTGEERYTIFIDQFEEYILSHTTTQQKIELGNEINDLQREIGETTTLAVSTHPQATDTIVSSTPEAETFTRVDTSSIRLPKMTSDDLLEMVALYMEKFRVEDFEGDRFYPFDRDALKYAAERTDLVPRGLILALRAALYYGALKDYPIIDGVFVNRNHRKVFGGSENKWAEFSKGAWKYKVT